MSGDWGRFKVIRKCSAPTGRMLDEVKFKQLSPSRISILKTEHYRVKL
jgi:hypothetical protein